MHQLIDKNKYFIYFFSFLFLSTLNNLSLNELNFFKIKTIEFFEEDLKTNTSVKNDLKKKLMIFKNQNIFSINKDQIKSQILKNEWILKFSIQKKYPSKLMVNFQKAAPIAKIFINNQLFFVGSNFRLIKSNISYDNLPNIFGSPKMKDLNDLINKIRLSKIDYKIVSDFYYLKSGRWNLKTKNNIVIKLNKNKIIESLNLASRMLENTDIVIYNSIDFTVTNQIIVN